MNKNKHLQIDYGFYYFSKKNLLIKISIGKLWYFSTIVCEADEVNCLFRYVAIKKVAVAVENNNCEHI